MFDGIRITNERLITASGLSVAGLLLSRTQLAKRLNEYRLKDNANPHIKNSDVAFAYIGLLCQGKSDFDYIREMDSDPDFYCKALGIHEIPSSETLRQRLDMVVGRWWPHQIDPFRMYWCSNNRSTLDAVRRGCRSYVSPRRFLDKQYIKVFSGRLE